MAAASRKTSVSNVLPNSSSEIFKGEKEHRRMMSNRESARRSRIQRQEQLDSLKADIDHYHKENAQICAMMQNFTENYMNVTTENAILRARHAELRRRLNSLYEIIRSSYKSSNAVYSQPSAVQFVDTEPPLTVEDYLGDTFNNPASAIPPNIEMFMNQPTNAIAPANDVFMF